MMVHVMRRCYGRTRELFLQSLEHEMKHVCACTHTHTVGNPGWANSEALSGNCFKLTFPAYLSPLQDFPLFEERGCMAFISALLTDLAQDSEHDTCQYVVAEKVNSQTNLVRKDDD